MITLSIDLRLIDQSKCKKMVRRNGEAATFCDIVLIETPGGQYGDYMVKQDTSKEDRAAGVQMPILGNAKNRGSSSKPAGEHSSRPLPQRPAPQRDPDLDTDESSEIPF